VVTGDGLRAVTEVKVKDVYTVGAVGAVGDAVADSVD
jgi:hypothetical protein